MIFRTSHFEIKYALDNTFCGFYSKTIAFSGPRGQSIDDENIQEMAYNIIMAYTIIGTYQEYIYFFVFRFDTPSCNNAV